LVLAAFRLSFLNWIVDAPGWLVSRFVSIDFHEGDGAFGFLLAILLGWLWASTAAFGLVWSTRRVYRRSRRGKSDATAP
jgi:hypothetical protein